MFIAHTPPTLPVLPVMEQFYTIQGEGVWQGQAAYFIRLGGCDVGCHWCDVKDSWDASRHPQIKEQKLIEAAAAHEGKMVVITGGEPLMHNLDSLTHKLQEAGLRTHIETSGATRCRVAGTGFACRPKNLRPLCQRSVGRHMSSRLLFITNLILILRSNMPLLCQKIVCCCFNPNGAAENR